MKRNISTLVVIVMLLTILAPFSGEGGEAVMLTKEQALIVVGGSSWECAGTLLGVGIGFIGLGLAGPLGWGAALIAIGSGTTAISGACG